MATNSRSRAAQSTCVCFTSMFRQTLQTPASSKTRVSCVSSRRQRAHRRGVEGSLIRGASLDQVPRERSPATGVTRRPAAEHRRKEARRQAEGGAHGTHVLLAEDLSGAHVRGHVERRPEDAVATLPARQPDLLCPSRALDDADRGNELAKLCRLQGEARVRTTL